MSERKAPSSAVELEVLLASRRRCCLCFGLHKDLGVKQGQLAHVNRDPSDSSADNLAFMCLEHHDWFDTRPSQSKRATPEEAKAYRQQLYDELRRRDAAEAAGVAAPPAAPASAPKAPQPFQRITVEDQRLKLRWSIRRPPKEWLDWRNIRSTISPGAVHQVLDGPFHAAPDCNAPLEEPWVSRPSGGYPIFKDTCPSCGERVFRTSDGGAPLADTVRAQALEEVQRMARNKPVLDGADITLERPAYWKVMLAP